MSNRVEIVKDTSSNNLFGSNLLDYLKDKYLECDTQDKSRKINYTEIPNNYER